ncbi:translationally-controlled tumor protein homolog [Physella acuta]|uniref:translationally-controlled tumor protein homolog n=1 Tax=Physella acuta TaxID=109671 RepID=UPI0027DAF9B9|nr:translationally-controlled tumor protein homolog isoform X1 [Physella acuta]XP_059164151.1 translationally-controlled tumor protein homolog isoform X2 [Physella acuta]XP_059164599.1 translationally-controlled tumor protein homolog [Physella acuta]
MRVYKCIVTGDELFTDTYPIELKDGLYKIKGKYVTRSDKVDDSLLGANPSAEEQEEGADENSTSGIDVVLDNRLMPTAFGSKKEFQAYFKDFVKRIEENKKENDAKFDVDAWRKEIQNTFKIVCANFDYEFYTGSSSNPDGSIALVRWEAPAGETDEIPFVYFFADGVKEEKV